MLFLSVLGISRSHSCCICLHFLCIHCRLKKFRAKFLELHQRRKKTQQLCVAAGSIAIEELKQMDEFFVNLPNTLYTPKQAARFMRFIHENKALGIVINSNIEKLIPLPHQQRSEASNKYRSNTLHNCGAIHIYGRA